MTDTRDLKLAEVDAATLRAWADAHIISSARYVEEMVRRKALQPAPTNTPTRPGYYWAQWRKAAPGTRDGDELTPCYDWQPVQVFENTLDDQHPEYLMVEVGGVEKAQSLDGFIWGPAIPPFLTMEAFHG